MSDEYKVTFRDLYNFIHDSEVEKELDQYGFLMISSDYFMHIYSTKYQVNLTDNNMNAICCVTFPDENEVIVYPTDDRGRCMYSSNNCREFEMDHVIVGAYRMNFLTIPVKKWLQKKNKGA